MLIINCTKAAAEFFSKTRKGEKISPVEAAPEKTLDSETVAANFPGEWQWMVHAIKVNAKNILVAMDYTTRFSIALGDVKKGDDADFLNRIEHHLIVHVHELMRNIDAGQSEIEASIDEYQRINTSLAFYQRGDRSVQSSINDVVWHFRQHTNEIGSVPTGVDLISQDVFVNQLIRKRRNSKDYFYPHHEFLRQWLVNYANKNEAQANASISLLHEREKAAFLSRHPGLVTKQLPSTEALPMENQELPQPSSQAYRSKDSNQSKDSNVVYLDDFRKK